MSETVTVTKTKSKPKTAKKPAAKAVPKIAARPKKTRLTMMDRVHTQVTIPLPRKFLTYLASVAGISNATNAAIAAECSAVFTNAVRSSTRRALWVASICGRTGITIRDVRLAEHLFQN